MNVYIRLFYDLDQSLIVIGSRHCIPKITIQRNKPIKDDAVVSQIALNVSADDDDDNDDGADADDDDDGRFHLPDSLRSNSQAM